MLKNLWFGKDSLLNAFSFFFVGGLLFWYFSSFAGLALELKNPVFEFVLIQGTRMIFFIFSWVAVWRCAPNTPFSAFSRIARLLVILHALLFLGMNVVVILPLMKA